VTRHVGQMTKVKMAKVRVKVTISHNVTNVSAAITLKSAKNVPNIAEICTLYQ